MKKLLSVLLALTMVLSMGVMSFAADDATTASPEDDIAQITDWFNSAEVQKFFADAGVALKKAVENPEDIAAELDAFIEKAAKELGFEVGDFDKVIQESGLIEGFGELMDKFGGGTNKVTTKAAATEEATEEVTVEDTAEDAIVDTGSAVGGLAIFATLSIAAAAAFVCTKKN